jgi:hypothetical protein
MIGIHTETNVTLVAHQQPRRNLAAEKRPRHAMRTAALSPDVHQGISIAVDGSAPQPAPSRRVDKYLPRKSFFESEFH